MGRGRAPCCQKVGLNKGSWSPEEDIRLVSYILKHGHGNWRALPKQAGLLRCGKSCRLRWINYLRPDIKRGNFSKEEEDTIISLHTILGNKWSKIASYLPGRTDNEIKNVWNTHLKKRLSSDNFASSVPAPSMEDDVILGDVAIDPELWNDAIVDIPAAQGKDAGNEQKSWLSYLEEELGLFEDGAGEEQFSAIQDGDLSGVCFHEQTTSYSSS